MNELDIWLLAVGLAMDCLAVSIASGILLKRKCWKTTLTMAFFFGFFQALMPFLGWMGASAFSHLIQDFDHWIAFSILAFLGGRMIVESRKGEEERSDFDPTRLKVIFTLAIATSIDALAVGVSFAFLDMTTWDDIAYPIGIIGLVSFLFSLGGTVFGIHCGCKGKRWNVELVGGAILILIGIKIVIDHLFFNS